MGVSSALPLKKASRLARTSASIACRASVVLPPMCGVSAERRQDVAIHGVAIGCVGTCGDDEHVRPIRKCTQLVKVAIVDIGTLMSIVVADLHLERRRAHSDPFADCAETVYAKLAMGQAAYGPRTRARVSLP